MNAVITLTTDFGLSDPYVAAMKGIILCINPAAQIVDISHDIHPHQIEEGAFVLAAAWPYFPPGSIHIAVVDPGVGGNRKSIALSTPQGVFVGPDNGILAAALPDSIRRSGRVRLPNEYRAVAISEPRFLHEPVSATFHGRDVFAPVAAHISLGTPLEALGRPVSTLAALPPFRAVRMADGNLGGRVIHIDRFGNLITNIEERDISAGRMVVEVMGHQLDRLSRTYGESSGLMALIGSSGFLEIAVNQGSAARLLGAEIGTPVTVQIRTEARE